MSTRRERLNRYETRRTRYVGARQRRDTRYTIGALAIAAAFMGALIGWGVYAQSRPIGERVCSTSTDIVTGGGRGASFATIRECWAAGLSVSHTIKRWDD